MRTMYLNVCSQRILKGAHMCKIACGKLITFSCVHVKRGPLTLTLWYHLTFIFFILNNTINILQTNIGFGRVTSSSFSLHFTIVDMTFYSSVAVEKQMYPDE